MQDCPTQPTPVRARRRRLLLFALVAVGVLAVSAALRNRFGQSPLRELTQEEKAEITALVQRETASPLRSLTPQPDGTVQAFVGGERELGGQILQLQKAGGSWRILRTTLLF